MKLGEKLENILSFTCPTPLSDICISCYIECCILAHIISFMHHASSWVSEKKVSKVRKFLQKTKLSVLINYSLIVIDYTIIFETMIDLFRSLCFNRLPCDIIDYFSFYKCFKSDREHFNRLNWGSNRLHCSWVVSSFWEEHFNWLKR